MGVIFDDGLVTDRTMTSAELHALQGENGEMYRGMQATPNDGLVTDRTMTSAELHALQGENGEMYRGMQVTPNDGLVTDRTMTSAELHALQGENGEIYRGVAVIDPEVYKKETTGTVDENIAQIMTELSQFNYKDVGVVSEKVGKIVVSEETVQKLVEYRAGKTMDMLYGTGDYNIDRLFTDVAILNALQQNGIDLSNISINASSFVNDNNQMTIIEFIDSIDKGIREKESYGYGTIIMDPNNPQGTIDVTDALEQIKEKASQLSLQNFHYAKQAQLEKDSMDIESKLSTINMKGVVAESNYGGNHI